MSFINGFFEPDPLTAVQGEMGEEGQGSGYSHDPDLYAAFWFHPDHLGSSNYITNLAGNVSQHMEYLPFGETLVEEHLNSNNSPYKFNGKELDEETGNYYYGARYYDPKMSIWLSVDPLAEEYPGWSPYNYTLNNPINLVDPDGKAPTDHWKIDNKGNARLIDTKGDKVWIKNKGDKNYTLITNYNFSKNKKAIKTIVNHYASDFSLFESKNHKTKIENYKSAAAYRYENKTKESPPFAYVKRDYDKGFSILGFQISKPSLFTSGANIVLTGGYIAGNAANKWDLRNSLGHEYKHILDNIHANTLLKQGFRIDNIKGMDRGNSELRAIKYQRSLDSWDCTTKYLKKAMKSYENKYSN
jgi:RHS repeat-associated protein